MMLYDDGAEAPLGPMAPRGRSAAHADSAAVSFELFTGPLAPVAPRRPKPDANVTPCSFKQFVYAANALLLMPPPPGKPPPKPRLPFGCRLAHALNAF